MTPTGGDTSYLTTDHLGSTRLVTDSGGNVEARYDYLPFGGEIAVGVGGRNGAMSYGGPDTARQKFTQKERDNESGLDYFLARYYSSAQGRFTSVDPAMGSAKPGRPQSWNRYVYTLDNPLNYVDPSGLIWGYTQTDSGGKKYRWYDDHEKLKNDGATEVGFDEAGRFIYKAITGQFIRLDGDRNHWDAYDTGEQAFYGTHGETGDNSSTQGQAIEIALCDTGGRILGRLVGALN